MLSSTRLRCPRLAGRKPLKRNESAGKPLATSAARKAEAPGIGTTGTWCRTASEMSRYPVMIQQLLGLPRILTGNKVGFLEHAQSSQSDVVKVPDRCADQI